MNRNQFELSMNQAKPSDWAHFEALCSKFLAGEHPLMRTMASASGDGGRDSVLLSPDGKNNICAQYSVAADWEAKIKKTQTRLNETFGEIKVLIFLSNQEIGAKGDKVKKALLDKEIFLDIRDKSWFLDRFDSDEQKLSGANEFFEKIGRPYLEGLEVICTKRSALTNQEAKAALVYLGMQWEDAHTDKGLTKLSYEALVRSALRKTNAQNPMLRATIYAAIHSYLPSQPIELIKQHVNSAINRLDKNVIKYIEKIDQFHLAFEEHQRLAEKLAFQDIQDRALDQEILHNIENLETKYDEGTNVVLSKITKQVLDLALLRSGENFAASVLAGSVQRLDADIVRSLILNKLAELTEPNKTKYMEHYTSIIESALNETIRSENESVRKHIKTLSDTYTLFAFLRETPDVQKVTKKIFSFGKIWLDTTLILPLLADCLKSEENEKRFSLIIKDLIACGVDIYVCQGTVNEVLNHMRLALACSVRGAQWQGRIPYLYSQYIQSGRESSRFSNWISQFKGVERPEQDILDFLNNELKIQFEDLTADYLRANEELRFSVDRLWREVHKVRRSSSVVDCDSETIDILIQNDVVSYVGIIERRRHETSTELGYQHWWLTIDSTAWEIRNSLKNEIQNPPSSPLMSLDFLVQTMSFGPNKSFLTRSDEQLLPVLLDLDISQVVPPEVLRVAEEVRQQNEGQLEYVIRRKVRDACDRARRQVGNFTKGIEKVH